MTPPLPVDGKMAARKLAASDPVLAGVIERVGPCPLMPVPEIDLSSPPPLHYLISSFMARPPRRIPPGCSR
jgi:hypothetical protein